MNRQDKFIGIHHGARELENDILLQSIPGLKNIGSTIKQFRKVAFNYNDPNSITIKNINKNGRERFNNNISILGNRGMGKSSALLTVVREITNNRLFIYDDSQVNTVDIINPMIDPEDIQSDILGWVITSLSERIEEMKKGLNQYDEEYFEISKRGSPLELFNKLEEKRRKLVSCYSICGDEYNHVALQRSMSVNDYSKNLQNTLTSDYELHHAFEEFIDCLVDTKRRLNNALCETNYKVEQEPLIYFFFDDLDMSSEKSIKILKDILSYFYHQNIVIFILGDYAVFEHSIKTFFLSETKDVTLKMDEFERKHEIVFSKNRAEYFLKKVLPPSYRYYIGRLANDKQKAKIHYHSTSDNSFEKMNVFQLLSYIFYTGFEENYKNRYDSYLKAFFLPRINRIDTISTSTFEYNKLNYEIEDDDFTEDKKLISFITDDFNINYLYAYLSVFSENTRGFMNAYNYLCKEAENIHENKNINDSKKYWTSNKLQEFIQVIINSKHTYSKYENEIKKFLSIKLDEVDYNKVDNNSYTKLRIDCEELHLFVIQLMNKLRLNEYNKDSVIEDDYIEINEEEYPEYIKREIKSIIMLPILINELFYAIHRENYKQRYESIKSKLKNILVNTFVNSLNDQVMLLPRQLGMRRTLCIFQQVATRMSVESLRNINNYNDNFYGNSNNKKYIVQLYLAIIELANAGAKNDDDNTLLNKKYYEEYKESMYTSLDVRDEKEKEISKLMNLIFRNLDREWLADKIKLGVALELTVRKIEYQVRNLFLKTCIHIPKEFMYPKLDNLYEVVNDIEDDELKLEKEKNNKYSKDGSSFYGTNKNNEKDKSYKWIKKYFEKLLEYLNKNENFPNDEINQINNYMVSDPNIFVKIITNRLRTQISNTNGQYDVLKINISKKKIENIKKFLNMMDDFKTEIEITISRLSNLFANEYNIISSLEEQIIKYYGESFINSEDNNGQRIIEKHGDIIIKDCIRKNKSGLKDDINKLLYELFKSEEVENIYMPIDDITENITSYLIGKIRTRRTSKELQELLSVFERSIESYYMYLFILEACKVYENKDTWFFHTFKNGIEYGK